MADINIDNLTQNMRVKLDAFNNEGVAVSNETIHSEVLSETDGFKGVGSSAPLYKGSIMWTVWANGGKKVTWPAKWLDMSVLELAEHILGKLAEAEEKKTTAAAAKSKTKKK
jgi:hypothetical protein